MLALLLALARPALAQINPAWQSALASSPTMAGSTAETKATAVDPATGAVFVTGCFTGQVSFGSTVLTSTGARDVFVARYNPGSNTWAWASGGGSVNEDVGYGIATDGSNVYVSGSYFGNATFGGLALAGGGINMFVAAYSATAGAGVWVQRGGGSTSYGYGIATDGAKVYVTGLFGGSGTFAGQVLNSGSDYDVFVAAYTTAGTGVWAISDGGSNYDQGNGIATDGSRVYVTGTFTTGTVIAGQTLSGASTEVFVAAYSASSGSGLWAKSGGGSGIDAGSGVATDGTNVYVTGSYTTDATFAGQALSSGTHDVFVAAYSAAAGAGVWAKSASSSIYGEGYGVATDGTTVYVTGAFRSNTTIAGQALTGADRDVFVAAYSAAAGADRWATSGGSSSTLDYGYGIATDGTNAYMGGVVSLPAAFGAHALPGNSTQAAVLARLVLPPTITSLSPTSGAAGTSVTITGTNLNGATQVRFNGTSQTTITGNTTTGLTVTVPAGASTGNVTVTTPTGTSNGLPFTVLVPSLAVSRGGTAYPNNGTAYGFGSQGVGTTSTAVAFTLTNNGTAPLTISGIGTTGDFAVSGAVPTTVASGGGTATVSVTFTPTATGSRTGTLAIGSNAGGGTSTYTVNLGGTGLPELTSISPSNGPTGTNVTLTGAGLTGTTVITFNGLINHTVSSGYAVNAAGTQITGIVVPNGAVSGNVTITSPNGTSNAVVYTVTVPSLAVSRGGTAYPNNGTAYGFGNQVMNTTSAAVAFTLTNSGTAPLTISGIGTTGDFAVSGAVPTTVASGGGTATVSVTFTPTATGSRTGTLVITSNAGGGTSTYTVNLGGTGLPELTSISPSSGPTGTVVVIDGVGLTGTTVITFNGLINHTVSSGYAVNAAGTQITGIVVPGGAVAGNLTVTTPVGTSNGILYIVTVPSLAVSRGGTAYPNNGTAYGFGNQVMNTTSAAVAFTLTNNGTAPLTISGIGTTGDFAVSGAVPTTVASGGGTATVSVTFTPTATGSRTGTLVIASNAGGGSNTYTVNLGGTGLMASPLQPTITSFTPASGPVGTVVSIAGTNLTGATAITFSGSSGNVVTTGFTVVSPTSITGVVVPAGAITGTLTVTTPAGTSAASAGSFSVTPSLSNLVLSAGAISPAFAGGTTAYTLTVPATTTTTTVTPTNAQTAGGALTVNGTAVASGAVSGPLALSPGTNTLTVVVNPAGAGTATTYTVTVTRTSCVVTALAQNVSVALDASGNASTTAAAVNNGSSSTCGAVSLSLSQTAFTCANVGTPVPVTLTVTDGFGGSATANATVTVTDGLAPTAVAQNLSVQLGANGTVAITAAQVNNGSSDNCTAAGSLTLAVSPSSFGCANVGANPVTLTVTDARGNASTATATVTVAAPPTATLTGLSPNPAPAGTTVTATGTNLSGATALTVNGASATISGLSATGFTFVVPAGAAVTGNVVVTAPCSQSVTRAFATAYPDLTISTGTLASPVIVPAGTYGTITVTGTGVAQFAGAVVATTAVVVNGVLLTDCLAPLTGSGSFTLNAGATLGICDSNGIAISGASGAVQISTRSFSTDATYIYNGTQAQSTGTGLPATVRALTIDNPATVGLSAPVAIAQTLTLANSGNLLLNLNPLTLRSDAGGTALVVNSGTGVVTGGTATVQRYLTTTNPSLGYRHYSSPVSGNTLSDLATGTFTPVFSAAYNTRATAHPAAGFPTVLGYDQARLSAATASPYTGFDKGWFSPAATDAMGAARGYAAQLRGTELVDFTGTLRTGDYARALPRAAGTAGGEGLHLVGNPYPAPIDWNLVTAADRPGVDAAFYVFESSSQYGGAYRSAVNGVGSSSYIGSSQGFFVRVTPGQAAGTLTFKNAHRLTDYAQQVAVRRGAADARPLVQLALAGSGAADNLYVYAEAGATPGVDAQYDAAKLANPSGLNLAALAATGEALAIDGRPAFAAATLIPLNVQVPAAGTYNLTAAALANLPATTAVTLTDALTGQTTDLRRTARYAFTAAAAAPAVGRFFLNLAPAGALATAGAALTEQVQVYPNPARSSFALLLPAGTAATPATLVNSLGQTVRTLTATAATTVDVAGLAAGVYTLRLTLAGQPVTMRVVVE